MKSSEPVKHKICHNSSFDNFFIKFKQILMKPRNEIQILCLLLPHTELQLFQPLYPKNRQRFGNRFQLKIIKLG